MDKAYNHKTYEADIYLKWEGSGAFKANSSGKPYTVLMPPPNANASLHAGHAMYTVDDIVVRWKRMQGFSVEWLPGADHAGFETQFVYEKHLAKEGKSRMNFDRQTLYDNVYKFVKENSGLIFEQFKRLGFSADWDRSVFTLDENVVNQVVETFRLMESEGKVYRDEYIVNFCTHCGTSLAELEVEHEERKDPLYYVMYPLVLRAEGEPEHIVVATVRPEPIWADTHLAVNPGDKKNNWLVGRRVANPLTGTPMEIIADEFVDPNFGTGIVKLTPAHDSNDFTVAKKHGLPINVAIGWDGKMSPEAKIFPGLKVAEAREKTVGELSERKLLQRVDENYLHSVGVCYKCKRVLEPMIMPNWYIKVEELKQPVIKAVKENKVKFYPSRFKKQMLDWLEIMHDWPISRQIVWGIQIPVWYEVDRESNNINVWWLDKNKRLQIGNLNKFLDEGVTLKEIEAGLQKVYALTGPNGPKYVVSLNKPGEMYLPETDTFDTWFSSGQWPLVTLKNEEFNNRFPTDFIGTLADILKFWISRMIMFSIYLKNEVPFKDVYLWSMVADSKGVKMSKSKGNVINPVELVEKYGADALRMTVIFGVAPGGKIPLAEEKVRGMRNFANKIWNMGRFVKLKIDNLENKTNIDKKVDRILDIENQGVVDALDQLIKDANVSFKKYRFSDVLEAIYEFAWHQFADIYIEKVKDKSDNETLRTLAYVYIQILKLLHPFAPFVTEAVYQELTEGKNGYLMNQKWPQT